MKKAVLLLLLVAGTALAGTRVFVEVGGGPAGYRRLPPPPPPVHVMPVRPPCPGPGYYWVEGYWRPSSRGYVWREGGWMLKPHPKAKWVPPRYHRGVYFYGYWVMR